MHKTIIIDGEKIHDIPSFYTHINDIFMQDVDWKLGHSLDAFSDLLYGGFGLIESTEPIDLVWLNFEKNRTDLGRELTLNHYRQKLLKPNIFNMEIIDAQIDELEQGRGKTYFDILLEIIGEHENITLIPR
ncbi:MAG: barstar family protein [Sphingobacterium sp.]|uniref:barstar family protein n=1 Tax=Sphingobacterium sp. JB170 TaxID=1434842 RepID=UPI000B34EC92|nr:barstar family protein [Sphingobacterium sp. JB170]